MVKDICKFNAIISCTEQTKCEKCNWNPTYFEEKKKKLREERLQKVKDNEKNTTLL